MNINELSFDELKEKAKSLGVTFGPNIGESTLRERLEKELGIESDVTPSFDESVIDLDSVKEEKKGSASKSVRILIAESEKDKQPVYVGVNGKSYRIKRGVEVDVPESVWYVLNKAKQTVKDKDGTERKVPSYPFQVVR